MSSIGPSRCFVKLIEIKSILEHVHLALLFCTFEQSNFLKKRLTMDDLSEGLQGKLRQRVNDLKYRTELKPVRTAYPPEFG